VSLQVLTGEKLKKIELVKAALAPDLSYPSFYAELADIAVDLLRTFERRWTELAKFFEEVTGKYVEMPSNIGIRVLRDFQIDLIYQSENLKRPAGSEFYALFAEELGKKLSLSKKGIVRLSRILNALAWNIPVEERIKFRFKNHPFTKESVEVWKEILEILKIK